MPEPAHSRDEAANHQLPISGSLLNHPNSFHRGMFKLNAKFDADSLLYLLTHFECNSHTVHMLAHGHLQPPLTGIVKLSLYTNIPVQSPWLLSYMDVVETVLIILTMAGLFPDRPCVLDHDGLWCQ